ncbi:LysR family transcriptional regulator [Fundicoccus culcitae]|uniref:LysR family transcriptional regulator n=1 Tax=Fundicoccus culcitae TaxID=2969821 RepID=A0ABY5P7V3_9LACT|nr:LysR family transcriptional regulator [Fundicoccus culcitae]UUX34817.1 LysR family transcriptional regulator [Fundicoccus culcitae]
MNTKQLECFINLSETLNFSETAKNLYITQPAVSHQIKALEDELELQLFIRSKRTVTLTPAGLSLYKDMKDIFIKAKIAISKAKNYSTEFNSNISIGYEGNLLELEKMPFILSSYKKAVPNSHIYLNYVDYKERKNSLLTNKYDVIFTVKENIIDSSEITYHELFNGKMVCVMPKEHHLSNSSSIKISDLGTETLIFLNPLKCPSQMGNLQDKILLDCPDATIYYSDSSNISYTLIKAGLGIAIMPDFVCPKDDTLTVLPLDVTIPLSYGAATLSQDMSKEIKTFISIAEEIFSKA